MPRRSIDYSVPDGLQVIDIKTGKTIEESPLPVICRNIRHYRIASGMEQKEFAEKIGVHKNAVSSWENGRTRPDINLIPAICRELSITPYELLGINDEHAKTALPKRAEALLDSYLQLDEKYKTHVDTVVQSLLRIQEEENVPELERLDLYPLSLAAGPGENFYDITETTAVYLHNCIPRADALFPVNGSSMEPDYHNGDYVYVELIPDGSPLRYGEIGVFLVGNTYYIKQYEKDGLHSLNSAYSPMLFDADFTSVYLIGRVLGVVPPEDIATPEEEQLYLKYHPEEE